MIIYSKNSNINNSAIGKLETPIKMIIERESDLLFKKDSICSALFNIENSSHFGETIITRSDFDIFRYAAEGEGAALDNICDLNKKFIEHVQFMKEFVVTAEMMEDSQNGISTEAKRRAENFIRAYYKTVNKLCSDALANGLRSTLSFGGAVIDTTVYDGYPLFSTAHAWGKDDKVNPQPNSFGGNIFRDENGKLSEQAFGDALVQLSNKIRNMKNDLGEPLGYVADTIIIPGNQPFIETLIKRTCGSYSLSNDNSNTLNVHFGNWNIIVLPTWESTYECCIVMSSEANKSLGGNMFFNRVPLTVTNWVDHHTGNYIWNGRCRFGIGFGTYKHAVFAKQTLTEEGEFDPL